MARLSGALVRVVGSGNRQPMGVAEMWFSPVRSDPTRRRRAGGAGKGKADASAMPEEQTEAIPNGGADLIPSLFWTHRTLRGYLRTHRIGCGWRFMHLDHLNFAPLARHVCPAGRRHHRLPPSTRLAERKKIGKTNAIQDSEDIFFGFDRRYGYGIFSIETLFSQRECNYKEQCDASHRIALVLHRTHFFYYMVTWN
jgi:hypothetical protein